MNCTIDAKTLATALQALIYARINQQLSVDEYMSYIEAAAKIKILLGKLNAEVV